MSTDQEILTTWQMREESLIQLNFIGTLKLLQGNILNDFEFGAEMRLKDTATSAQAGYGILAQYDQSEYLMIRFIKKDERWALAIESEGIEPVVNCVLSLSETFDPGTWHRLNLIQHQSQTHILLDDDEVLQISDTTKASQPGLITQRVPVEFTNIWQVGLE